jgi:hypothetical protein
MKSSKVVVGLVILAVAAGMVVWWPGSDPAEPVAVPRPPGPAVVGEGEGTGGSWFCAARSIGIEDFGHSVRITSASVEPITVALTAFGEETSTGLEPVEVLPNQTTVVDIAKAAGSPGQSVMVESPDGPIAVEHRFQSPVGADQVACSSFSASDWYFPAVATTRDAKAVLSLFNPFPSDAAVDVEIALETGVRIPRDLSGIVVPSGTTRVVDLGEVVQRRDQFSAAVRARSGTIVAEVGQSFDGTNDDLVSEGVRLMAGSRIATDKWTIAAGMVDPSSREKLVVYNPREDAAEVVVQVIPYGGVESLPEPFELDVPGLRYSFINLEQETRIPASNYHAIQVESSGGAPVVVANTMTFVEDSPETSSILREGLEAGTSGGPASAAPAGRWMAPGLEQSDLRSSAIFIHNPSDGIAQVDVRIAGSQESQTFEVPANDSLAVGPRELGARGRFTVLVDSDTELFVDRLITFSDTDFSLNGALPRLDNLRDLNGEGG